MAQTSAWARTGKTIYTADAVAVEHFTGKKIAHGTCHKGKEIIYTDRPMRPFRYFCYSDVGPQ